MSEVSSSQHPIGRIAYIDAVKAICIFLMVVGHYSRNTIILSYIYVFHMPAFLIVSGFLYRPHPWKKTIAAFSFPVIVFSLINLVVSLLLGRISIDHLTLQYVVIHIIEWRHGFSVRFFEGVWFIWVLAGLRLLFGDISGSRAGRKVYISIAITMIAYMTFEKSLVSMDTLFKGYYIGLIIPSLPFFCIGMFLKEIRWEPKNIESAKFIVPLVIMFLLVPLTNNYCDIYNGNYGYSYLIAVVVATLFTLLLSWLASKLPPSRFIETISKGTLVVLGLHMTIFQILCSILPDTVDFLFPFITIVICYYAIVFCEKYCPILLGKVKSQNNCSFSEKVARGNEE